MEIKNVLKTDKNDGTKTYFKIPWNYNPNKSNSLFKLERDLYFAKKVSYVPFVAKKYKKLPFPPFPPLPKS